MPAGASAGVSTDAEATGAGGAASTLDSEKLAKRFCQPLCTVSFARFSATSFNMRSSGRPTDGDMKEPFKVTGISRYSELPTSCFRTLLLLAGRARQLNLASPSRVASSPTEPRKVTLPSFDFPIMFLAFIRPPATRYSPAALSIGPEASCGALS